MLERGHLYEESINMIVFESESVCTFQCHFQKQFEVIFSKTGVYHQDPLVRC